MAAPPLSASGAAILFEETYLAYKAALNAGYVARHSLWISFGILVYDHLLTLRREITLIWRSPPSVSKYGFLLNRYVVPTMLGVVFYGMAGFISAGVSENRCKHIMAASYVCIVVSLAISTLLVILRVITLWAHSRTAVFTLWGAFILSQCTAMLCGVMTIVRILPGTTYEPISGLCYSASTSPWFMGVWVSEIAFELAVLGATCWNTLDRPRGANETMARALRRDGIVYFAVIASLRIINLVLAATENVLYAYTVTYASWAIVTLIVSRLLLGLHALDRDLVVPRVLPRRASIFPAPLSRSQLASKGTGSKHSVDTEHWEMAEYGGVEIGMVESVVGHR